jgi:AcrR family transcriptional regulator
MDEKQATRDRILHAAMTRIMHYGYGKTTMAEIAADCDMSPGNIYRFFEAKIDIAEAIARKHYAEEHAAMAAVGRRKDTPDKKLKEMFLRKMRDNYEMFEKSGKILEVAEVLSKERPLFLNELLAQERVILRAVIEEGVATGMFAATDGEHTAEMMQAALVKFSLPQLFSHLSLPKLEREFEGVFGLLLNGLYKRGADAPSKARTKEQLAEH